MESKKKLKFQDELDILNRNCYIKSANKIQINGAVTPEKKIVEKSAEIDGAIDVILSPPSHHLSLFSTFNIPFHALSLSLSLSLSDPIVRSSDEPIVIMEDPCSKEKNLKSPVPHRLLTHQTKRRRQKSVHQSLTGDGRGRKRGLT